MGPRWPSRCRTTCVHGWSLSYRVVGGFGSRSPRARSFCSGSGATARSPWSTRSSLAPGAETGPAPLVTLHFMLIRQDSRQFLPESEKASFFSVLWRCVNRRPISGLRVGSGRMQTGDHDCPFMTFSSEFGALPEFHRRRSSGIGASYMRPDTQFAGLIALNAAIRFCGWRSSRAAAAPCSPC